MRMGSPAIAPLATIVPAIDVSHLSVRYGARIAVERADLQVAPGRMVAVVGPNGAGKSTLVKAVVGLVAHQEGSVRIFGEEIDRVRSRIAYVPQRAAVDWDFPASALDVVAMGLYGRIGWFRRIRRAHREEAREILSRVGLADLADRPIGALSGGQQQRVFLARALAQNADLVLLDEPLAGVDAVTEDLIFARLKDLRDAGRTVVVVHHDLETVADHFDDVVLINRRIIAAGPVAQAFTPANIAQAYGARWAQAVAPIVHEPAEA